MGQLGKVKTNPTDGKKVKSSKTEATPSTGTVTADLNMPPMVEIDITSKNKDDVLDELVSKRSNLKDVLKKKAEQQTARRGT